MFTSVHIWEILLLISASYLIGALPFSYLVGLATKKVDGEEMKAGTVSGTALHKYAGFAPLVVAGILDVGKGILVAIIFRYDGELLRSLAVGAAVAGHNWSPFLRGAGGRGLAPTLGGLSFVAWPATLWITGFFGGGRLLQRTSFSVFCAYLLLPLLVFVTAEPGVSSQDSSFFNLHHHWYVTFGALGISVIVFTKRALGDKGNKGGRTKGIGHRILFDQNPTSPETKIMSQTKP